MLNIRTVLNKHKTRWPESDDMTPEDFEINRVIEKLDQIAIGYEAKWGVYRLETLASPELAEKWQRQVEKINEAIENKNLAQLRDLVDGAIRGYGMLEAAALAAGHTPSEPLYWEIRKGSRIYRVVKTTQEARALQKPQNADTVILTFEEVVNLFDARSEQVYGTSEKHVKLGKNTGFDYSKGDAIPF